MTRRGQQLLASEWIAGQIDELDSVQIPSRRGLAEARRCQGMETVLCNRKNWTANSRRVQCSRLI